MTDAYCITDGNISIVIQNIISIFVFGSKSNNKYFKEIYPKLFHN